MGLAFGIGLVLASLVLATEGIGDASIVTALRLTARWAFLPFWLAYAGGAMAELVGPVLARLGKRGRDLGLTYASAMLVHVGLVVWLGVIRGHVPLTGKSLILFVVGIMFTYLLALFSIDRVAKALGRTGWRILRIVGMNYILFAFATDFLHPIIHPRIAHYGFQFVAGYLPFAAMCVAGPLLLLAAGAHRRLGMNYSRYGRPGGYR
jgi:hypothetical protein